MAKRSLAELYAKFRGSFWFLAALCIFVVVWIGLHLWFGIDRELGDYNSFLSTEASITTSLLLIDLAKNELMQRKQLAYMRDIMEAILEDTDMLTNINKNTDEHTD